jgi:hypothetical protein
MANPWLAIDTATSPVVRAREVGLARERFLQDQGAAASGIPNPAQPAEPAASGLRSPIVDSWRRSAAAGIDPSEWTAPLELDEQQARERFAEHPLGRLVPVLRE